MTLDPLVVFVALQLLAFGGWCIRVEVRLSKKAARLEAAEREIQEITGLDRRIAVAETKVDTAEGALARIEHKLDRMYDAIFMERKGATN